MAVRPAQRRSLRAVPHAGWLHHEHSLGRIGDALRRHRPVTIHNAFRHKVALQVLRALADVPVTSWRRDDGWEGGAYPTSGYAKRRWVLDTLTPTATPAQT